MEKDLEENRVRKLGEGEHYSGDGEEGEQNQHQDLALRIMRMKILHPQNPSKLVAWEKPAIGARNNLGGNGQIPSGHYKSAARYTRKCKVNQEN